MGSIHTYQIAGDPPPWSVTGVDKFIVGALDRVERQGGVLPADFRLSICPWGERNAIGGTPEEVNDITDPRMRLVHFTGCGRPYLVALFSGDEAERQQRIAMQHLPWSEHLSVELSEQTARLHYLDSTEDLWGDEEADPRSLLELFQQGELKHF